MEPASTHFSLSSILGHRHDSLYCRVSGGCTLRRVQLLGHMNDAIREAVATSLSHSGGLRRQTEEYRAESGCASAEV